ncbi:MAG: Asp23/Gls24 family envelope stress response protein [Rubrobacter sp.]|nr:Asp23/Gls24 family envelope stress response protein [Rubrobacter sp.]
MSEQWAHQQQSSPLQTERGSTRIEDNVVAKIAGIAGQEVEGVQMGGGTARAIGGFLDSVTGGGGETRGVAVEVGEVEAAIDLTMAVEYGKPIPQVSEAVRRNVINRIENLTGLQITHVNITVNDVLLPEERPQLERQREVEQQAQQQGQRVR